MRKKDKYTKQSNNDTISPRYFLVVQKYGSDEFFLNVVSSKFSSYKSASEWLNNELTKIKFPHAYIISIY